MLETYISNKKACRGKTGRGKLIFFKKEATTKSLSNQALF